MKANGLKQVCGSGDVYQMEEEPRKKKPDVNNLEVMSIEALEEYIGEFHAEIERIRAGIAGKEATPRPFSANNPP